MDHDLELIIPDPGNIWKLDFYKLLVSWKYWKLKSSTLSIILEILEIGFFFWLPGILKILEIGFFWFPISWKYWKLDFSIFPYPGNIGYWILLFSHILEIRAAGGRRRAGGSRGCVVLPWIIFGTCFLEFPDILEILEIWFFYILGFFQKRRAPKFHAGCTDGWAEISHMRPIQARKLKLFQTPISRWRRRRGPASYFFSVLFYYSSSSVIFY